MFLFFLKRVLGKEKINSQEINNISGLSDKVDNDKTEYFLEERL